MGSTQEYDLVVIGSGPGGQKAAIAAAKLGKSVAVIEEGPNATGLAAAVQQRHTPDVATQQQGADALRPAELVGGQAERREAARGEVHRQMADGLDRVGTPWRGKPILSAEQIEDVVTYLSGLRE